MEGRTERVLETRKMTNALLVVKGPETGLHWKKRWTKENGTMREGRLGYNYENGRYGLLSMDLWIDTGFHCGECMEVLVDDQWVQTRMEMNLAREWYLVGTAYCGVVDFLGGRFGV